MRRPHDCRQHGARHAPPKDRVDDAGEGEARGLRPPEPVLHARRNREEQPEQDHNAEATRKAAAKRGTALFANLAIQARVSELESELHDNSMLRAEVDREFVIRGLKANIEKMLAR